ncbi:MAG: hypothetical protein AAGA12_13095 [Pseudomonadota bacterium]
MEICLHVGAHRTGTTSFQKYMQVSVAASGADEVVYWGPKRTRDGMFAGLIKDPDNIGLDEDMLAKRSIGRIRFGLTKAAKNGATHLVVSEENMIGTMAQNFRSTQLYGQARARLTRFAPALWDQALRIGIAIRSYEHYWASAMSFRICAGMPMPCEDKLDMLVTQPRRWRDVICDINAVFPGAQIVVWPFEGFASRPSDAASALLGAASGMEPAKDMWCNASKSADRLADYLSERGDHAGARAMREQGPRYMPFRDDHIDKLRQDYSEDLAWLNAGADGLATYIAPTGDTSGGQTDTRGTGNERKAQRLVGAG